MIDLNTYSPQTSLADIETTAIGSPPNWMPDTIHMLTIAEAETDNEFVFVARADLAYVAETLARPNRHFMFGEGAIAAGVAMLMRSKTVVFHNGIGFDYQVLEHHTAFDRTATETWDSIVLCRLFHGNIKEDTDFVLFEKTKSLPFGHPKKLTGQMIGKHGLEAWGVRLQESKGDYKAMMLAKGLDPWAECNPDMIDYGIDDSRLLKSLWLKKLKPKMNPGVLNAVRVEHYMMELMEETKDNGIWFDVEGAEALYDELHGLVEHFGALLQHEFPDRYEPEKWVFTPEASHNELTELQRLYPKHPVYRRRFNLLDWQTREQWGEEFHPKRDRKAITPHGIYAQITKYNEVTGDGAYVKIAKVKFNPNSRPQIQHRLMEMGWVPEEFTDTGAPATDEKTLLKLEEDYPQVAKSLVKYLLLQKRLGQLKTGKKAWLGMVDTNGFLHPTIIPCNTVTGRASHMNPNISQVPSVQFVKLLDADGKPILDEKGEPKVRVAKGEEGKWGYDCRALFGVPQGWRMVGADLKGIELRCWAHYLWPYDDGALADVVLNKDIHEANRAILGFDNRRDAKAFLFALIYGAGDEKLGFIIEPLSPPSRQKVVGKEARKRFMRGVTGMNLLVENVQALAKRGWIKGLDGRRLTVRKSHAALNTLLQSAGAIVSKFWIIRIMDVLEREHGLKVGYDNDFTLMIYSHDELQFGCRAEHEQLIWNVCLQSALDAGKQLGIKLPIEADAKAGDNWAETH